MHAADRFTCCDNEHHKVAVSEEVYERHEELLEFLVEGLFYSGAFLQQTGQTWGTGRSFKEGYTVAMQCRGVGERREGGRGRGEEVGGERKERGGGEREKGFVLSI